MVSSRLSIISNSAFVVVGISALHAVAIVASALLEANCRSFKAARWASVGRTTRSSHRTCHSYRPTERGVHSRRYPRGPMVPGPVNTPGMRTMAFLSTAGEGDCCAATGAPPVTDVMTHTPIATSTLLIQFIICAHPPQKTNAEQYQFGRPSLAKDDTMKQPKVDVDQGWRQGCATRAGRGWPRCRSRPPATGQMLLLLNGLKVIDDRANVLSREDELRHVRMAGGKALRQSLGKPFDLVFARERSEGRGRRVRAGAGAADGMAAGAIPRQQQLAASCGRGSLLCQDRPSRAHGDHHDEIIESLPAHMLLLVPPVPHGRIGVTTKSKMGSSALMWLKSATRRLDGRATASLKMGWSRPRSHRAFRRSRPCVPDRRGLQPAS